MLKTLGRLLRSVSLAAIVMITLLIYSIFAMVVNQPQLFRKPIFLILGLVFLINLTACTAYQLRKLRWTAPLAIWGSVIFHLGLMIVCFGALLSFAYKIEGYLVLGEGEPRVLEPAAFTVLETGSWQRRWPDWQLQLVEQERHWRSDGSLAYTSSRIRLTTDKGEQEWLVEKGRPLIAGSWRFFHYATGYAPGIIVRKEGEILGAFLLPAEKKEERERGYRIKTLTLLPGLTIEGLFFPDQDQKSDRLGRPLLRLKINGSQELLTGNQQVDIGQYELELGEIRTWVGLETVYDPGAMLVFAGSWLATAGLGLWFFGKNLRR